MPTYRSWQPGIIPLRPLSFGDFLAVPFKAIRFNRAVVLGGPLLFSLIATVLMAAAIIVAFNDPYILNIDQALLSDSAWISPVTILTIVAAIIAMFMADVLSTAIVAPGVARAILGEKISFGAAWSTLVPRLGQILLLYVISSVLLLAAVSFSLVPWIIAIVQEEPAWIVLGLVGLIITIPAGMVITIITGTARAMVVLEKISAVAAISRMTRLIRGRFWWTVLIVFVTALLVNIVASILQNVGQFAGFIVMAAVPDNTAVMVTLFALFYGIAILITYVITYSYMSSVYTLIYTDLRMRHEGFDLDLARAAEARAQR